MRSDPIAYRNENYELDKDSRSFVSIAVNDDGTNKYYFTSHEGVPTPNPAQTIYKVLKTTSSTSQGLNTDLTIASIGNFSFSLVDVDETITQFQYDHLILGEGLKEKIVELYDGHVELTEAEDYALIQTQVIRTVEAGLDGSYIFNCADALILAKKKNLFVVRKTNLRLDLGENDTTVNCFSTTDWEVNPHGNSYSHLPNQSVYYFRITSASGVEYIAATGKTTDTFTGCQRGVLDTKKLEHKIDTAVGVAEERQPLIEELVYIEMPVLKLIPALLTGNLYGQIKNDSFTENTVIGLENHTSDSEGGWSGADTNNFSINTDGEVYLETTGSNWAIGDENPTSADQTTTIEAKINTSGDIAGACVRINADIDCYDMLLLNNGLWLLRRVLNNSVSNLAMGTISNLDTETYHTIGVQAIGTTIKGFIDGVEVASVTNSDVTAPGNVGIYMYNIAAGTSKITNITTEIIQGILPSNWHMGIDSDLINVIKFTEYATELWNTTDDSGAMVKFIGLEKDQGKSFVERELLKLLIGSFTIGSDGRIGIKRIVSVLSGSPYIRLLDKNHIITATNLKHDMSKLINRVDIDWAWDHLKNKYTRTFAMEALGSISKHGIGAQKRFQFKGVHSGTHTNKYIETRLSSIFDRFASPPLFMNVTVGHEFSDLEVGDIVRVVLEELSDYNTNATLDRSFEVQKIVINTQLGTVSLSLFSSSEKFEVTNLSSASSVLNDSFYDSEGHDLATYVGGGYDATTDYEEIAGVGHIKANCTWSGGANMNSPDNIFYSLIDLTVDDGITVTITHNVQLRTMGHRTIDGTIEGIGNGKKGAIRFSDSLVNRRLYGPFGTVIDYQGKFNKGIKGYVGTTISGGYVTYGPTGVTTVFNAKIGKSISSYNDSVPQLDLVYDSSIEKLKGIPKDMRGTSGSSGGIIANYNTDVPFYMVNGGDGGNSGAALFEINRGFSFGASGTINLSGEDGGAPSHYGGGPIASVFTTNNAYIFGGVGAGGGPGSYFVALDGIASPRGNLSNKVICKYGDMTMPCHAGTTPVPINVCGMQMEKISMDLGELISQYSGYSDVYKILGAYSYYNGTGTIGPDLGGYGPATHEQFIPSPDIVDEEPFLLPAPIITALETGTNATRTLDDGTVLPGVKIYFTPVTDSRVVGYMFEYKKSTDFSYLGAGHVLGAATTVFHITGLEKGITYDFRMQSVGSTSVDVSAWVEDSILVLGKEDLPPDIVWMQAVQDGEIANITWQRVVISDLSGYTIRYGERENSDWESSNTLTELTKGTKITTGDIPDGDWTVYIKAIDTSGNYSLNAAESDLVFTSAYSIITQEKQVPDWLGTKTNMIVHRTGVLVPNNTVTVASLDWEWVDEYCPNPFTNCYYEREISNGFDDDVRAWADYGFNLGPGEIESNQPLLELDYRTEAGSYDGYETWIKGFATGRYFKFKLSIDTSLGVPYFNLFRPTVDKKSYDQDDKNVSVSNGDTITFPKGYHATLSVNVFVIGAVPYLLTLDNITGTGFDIGVFNSDASPHVGAITIDWNAKGV
jgi:hypothetical protein